MDNINQVTLTGRVAQPPRKVPGGGYVFSLFQEQAYGSLTEAVPIYPVVFGWGQPPAFLRVNQSVIVVGRVRTRNFEQDVSRVVARALREAGKASDVEVVAGQLPAGLRDRRVAFEIVADRITTIDEGRGQE